MDSETGSFPQASLAARDALRRKEIADSLSRFEIDRYEDVAAHLIALREAADLHQSLLRDMTARD